MAFLIRVGKLLLKEMYGNAGGGGAAVGQMDFSKARNSAWTAIGC